MRGREMVYKDVKFRVVKTHKAAINYPLYMQRVPREYSTFVAAIVSENGTTFITRSGLTYNHNTFFDSLPHGTYLALREKAKYKTEEGVKTITSDAKYKVYDYLTPGEYRDGKSERPLWKRHLALMTKSTIPETSLLPVKIVRSFKELESVSLCRDPQSLWDMSAESTNNIFFKKDE